VVSSLLISTSLQKFTNSFEVYSPPLFDLSILIFLLERFFIKDLNSLNLSNTSSFDFEKVNPSFARIVINKRHIVYIPTDGG
jgi:hypothetical protein